MAKGTSISVRCAFAAQAVRRPLEALQDLVEEVRRADDVEAVHKMRVASRRLRNVIDLFFDELPAEERPRWLKRIRDVTRALGAARDLDVQLEFLREFVSAHGDAEVRPGGERLLADFEAARRKAQRGVVRGMDRLEADGTLKEVTDWTQACAPGKPRKHWTDPDLHTEAVRAIEARLADLMAYEEYVERPECVDELHAMRIAAKHLRYTLEVYAPLFARGLKAHVSWARDMQDALGALHDCDVWLAELPKMSEREHRRAGAARAKRQRYQELARFVTALLGDRQTERDRLYAKFVADWRRTGGAAALRRFQRTLGVAPREAPASANGRAAAAARRRSRESAPAPFDPAVHARWAPAVALATECSANEEPHSLHVTGLALRLFDELGSTLGLADRHRAYLTNAGLLHDIGWVEGRAGHHKTAARLIRESPRLPWSPRKRALVAAVARYHRGAPPRLDHAEFGGLPAGDRAIARKLAALLRLADGLDYTHQGLVRDLRCRVSPERVAVVLALRAPAAEEIARARKKSDLLGQVLNREVEVQWRLPETGPADPS